MANNMKIFEWPAQGLDLNPIENLWGIIKRAVTTRKLANKASVWEIIRDEWYKITNDECAALVRSIRRRCEEVIRHKGYPTKY